MEVIVLISRAVTLGTFGILAPILGAVFILALVTLPFDIWWESHQDGTLRQDCLHNVGLTIACLFMMTMCWTGVSLVVDLDSQYIEQAYVEWVERRR